MCRFSVELGSIDFKGAFGSDIPDLERLLCSCRTDALTKLSIRLKPWRVGILPLKNFELLVWEESQVREKLFHDTIAR